MNRTTTTTTAPARPGRNGAHLAGQDVLPPNEPDLERAALRCIVDAASSGSQAEVDALLEQLRPLHFYDLRHQHIFNELCRMRMAGHAVDLVTINTWFKSENRWNDCGGEEYARDLLYNEPTPFPTFSHYSEPLKALAGRRWALRESARLADKARAGDLDLRELRAELAETLETLEKAQTRERPLIELVTIEEAKAYVPDPKTFLVGNDMISRGEITVIAGLPGLGKSRLAMTLAFAGARGRCCWPNAGQYAIRRRWRTLYLQSENSMKRIKDEVTGAPEEYNEWIRISKPTSLGFADPNYRAAVRRLFDAFPADMVIIDAWSDVIKDEKFADYQEGLENVLAALPTGTDRPAIVIVCHLKKAILGGPPMVGRALLGQISGSFRIGQKARTCFIVQPASMDSNDDRVIFDCAKSNNDTPLPMSAWHRRNGIFEPCRDFDFDQWLNPPDRSGAGGRHHAITEEVMRELFAGRKATRKYLVEQLKDLGFSQPTAYRALDHLNGKFHEHLTETDDGFLAWND